MGNMCKKDSSGQPRGRSEGRKDSASVFGLDLDRYCTKQQHHRDDATLFTKSILISEGHYLPINLLLFCSKANNRGKRLTALIGEIDHFIIFVIL